MRLRSRSAVVTGSSEHVTVEHLHRNIKGGAARAAVFGMSDGLVTNVSLILGVAAAHPALGFVRLAGLAGLVSGAFSMSAGEYVSMRVQRELLERELEVERAEIDRHPLAERRELVHLYESRGIAPDMAADLADTLMRDPEVALQTHAREELGLDSSSLGSPWQAAGSSFSTFALGALLPLLPWLFVGGATAIFASVSIGAVASVVLGAVVARFTGRSAWRSGLRQLGISVLAAGVTFALGRLIGAGIGTT